MSDQSARLALPFLMPSQAQKHVTHNEALQLLDVLVQPVLEGVAAETPPAAPEEGDLWALGEAPTGAWLDAGGMLAAFLGGGWVFVSPKEGWSAMERGSGRMLRWDGAAWVGLALPEFDNLDHLGIMTTADATNRLAVAGAATLLTHAGAGHQVKINKAATGDTASLLYQTGWSGRAEMGLAGEDAFSIKVSADGSAWVTALRIAGATGHATGAAVQQSATDVTAGRLARADWSYGRGNLLGTVSQSAGVPTGAVIEQGTTANGSYTRFADGTQICTHTLAGVAITTAVGGIFRSAIFPWTFPMPFAALPALSGSVNAATGISVNLPASTASGVTEGRAYTSASLGNATISLMAVGRWV